MSPAVGEIMNAVTAARFVTSVSRTAMKLFLKARTPLTIVMYHTVSDLPGPETVSTSAFRQQIEFLMRDYRVIRLREIEDEFDARSKGPRARG